MSCKLLLLVSSLVLLSVLCSAAPVKPSVKKQDKKQDKPQGKKLPPLTPLKKKPDKDAKGMKPDDGPSLKASTARVVHGSPVTDPTEYPFVVDLSYHGREISSTRFCTGSLIAKDVVLTAAHCVLNNGYSSPVFATVGRIELDDRHADNARSRTFRTVASVVHPEYNGIGSPKDVALLLMNASSSATQVELSHSMPDVDEHGWVVGYGIQKLGTLEEAGRPVEILSGRLQKTELKVVERSLCDIPNASFVTAEGMLCTAGVKAGASACRGDSGGGLFIKRNHNKTDGAHKIMQVGIVSYGDRECAAEEAGIFTDVAHVREWILAGVDKLHEALHPVRLHPEAGERKQDNSTKVKQQHPGLVFRYMRMLDANSTALS